MIQQRQLQHELSSDEDSKRYRVTSSIGDFRIQALDLTTMFFGLLDNCVMRCQRFNCWATASTKRTRLTSPMSLIGTTVKTSSTSPQGLRLSPNLSSVEADSWARKAEDIERQKLMDQCEISYMAAKMMIGKARILARQGDDSSNRE
jgi:hypothetical protein